MVALRQDKFRAAVLISKSVALVPMGISCQSAHQVEQRKAKLELVIGEEMELARTPFDWRIVGLADIAAMIRENNPYPASPSELSGDRNRYWARRRCWFWHDKWDDFARFSSKQAHLWANWGRIGRASRQVFIASDTQNNLRRVLEPHDCAPPRVMLADLGLLSRQLAASFPSAELHFVTSDADQWAFGSWPDGVHLHRVAPDRTQWQGDRTAWGRILDRIVAPQPTAKAKP